jgi:DNA-binding transcriptional LysR family regulator
MVRRVDPFTLDQLRTLLAVEEAGSFSAAARKLRRVQSAVSQAMATLEDHLGLPLWDRSAKIPRLDDRGRAVLAAARRVCAEADALRRVVAEMTLGVEPSVHLCVDALFPLASLAELASAFATAFPTVDLRVDTETMSAVSARVIDGTATIGVVSPMGLVRGLEAHRLATVQMVPVVAPRHPLAKVRRPIPRAVLDEHVQIVLAERNDRGIADQAVLSTRTWRIAELHTKHALLCAGLGWGNLPEHMIREDLARRRLVRIRPAPWSPDEHRLTLSAVHRAGATFGPAHRWLLANLGPLCAREVAGQRARRR